MKGKKKHKELLITFFLIVFFTSFVSGYELINVEEPDLLYCRSNLTSCANAYDGDWNTFLRMSGDGMSLNYTIPQYTTSAKAQIKFGGNITNVIIPDECLTDYPSLVLGFTGAFSSPFGEFSNIGMRCGTLDVNYPSSWETQIFFYDSGGYKEYNYLYEVEVTWIIQPPPTYEDTPIYQTMESTGAGLGIFMVLLGNSLPLLLIGLFVVMILLAILTSVAYIIRKSITQSTKS